MAQTGSIQQKPNTETKPTNSDCEFARYDQFKHHS